MHACVHACMHAHIHTYIHTLHTNIHTYAHTHMYTYMHVYMYAYTYIHIYIYIYTHTHIYIYIYICMCVSFFFLETMPVSIAICESAADIPATSPSTHLTNSTYIRMSILFTESKSHMFQMQSTACTCVHHPGTPNSSTSTLVKLRYFTPQPCVYRHLNRWLRKRHALIETYKRNFRALNANNIVINQ